jgi:FKBP-type peptidyl-prolyl cis-trans isomerase (trigger factor)
MELDLKDVVEMTDAVIVSLSFTDKNGEAMTEYTQQSQTYVVKEDADTIISSFLTHKVGDQYTVEYTFPEDDEYHPGETVDVNVTIECIYYSDALHSGVVEAHLEELNEVLSNVKDAETLKIALRPYVLGYHLQDYIEEKIMGADIVVPSVWIEYEEARLGYRLTALSMTREQYLQEMNFTEEDIATSCECIARENMIAMLLYPQYFDPLTEEDLSSAYGAENIDYYIGMQGQPYLKLRLMRSMVYAELAKNTPVLDVNGNPLDLSIYFGEEEPAEEVILPSDEIPAETTPTN